MVNRLLLGLSTLVGTCVGHYTFDSFVVNGTVSSPWQYVRAVAPAQGFSVLGEPAKWFPVYDVTSKDIVCNRDAGAAAKTSTATVIAGSEVGWRITSRANDIYRISHQGPGLIYMSKAPNDDLEHYDGSGDWFKIAYLGPANNTVWSTFEAYGMTVTIPKTTPPGKYLLRAEHMYVLPQETQIFIECTHINVIGPGGGTPGPLVKFPGAYSPNDPGIKVTAAIAGGQGLLGYTPPGPAVWQG